MENSGGSLVSRSSLAAVHGLLSVCKPHMLDGEIFFPTVPLLSISGRFESGGGIRAIGERGREVDGAVVYAEEE